MVCYWLDKKECGGMTNVPTGNTYRSCIDGDGKGCLIKYEASEGAHLQGAIRKATEMREAELNYPLSAKLMTTGDF